MTTQYKPGERVYWWKPGHPGSGLGTVVCEGDGVFFAARVRLDATGEEMPAIASDLHPPDWRPTEQDEAAERARRQVGDLLYAAARYALAGGLTRSEWDAVAGFMWGQAAADHAHEVAAKALGDAAAHEEGR